MYYKPIGTALFACVVSLVLPNFVNASDDAVKSGEKGYGLYGMSRS